jgi:homeodomain-containing protein
MAKGRPKAKLTLTVEQREQLESLSRSRSLPAGLVTRARIILLSAAGKTNQQIGRQLNMGQASVGKWRRRFLQGDVAGLHDELRPGRPRPISDEQVAQLVRKNLETKPKEGTHWSVRQEMSGASVDQDKGRHAGLQHVDLRSAQGPWHVPLWAADHGLGMALVEGKSGLMTAINDGQYVMAPIPDPKLGPRRVDIASLYDTECYRPNGLRPWIHVWKR